MMQEHTLGSITISVPVLFMVAVSLLVPSCALLYPRKRYPPGPAGLPILGNVNAFLAGRWYETFTKWQKLYGDIVFAPSGGKPIYIVNSYKLAEESLIKSRFSSARPYSRMINHLMEWGWILTVSNPSKKWFQVRHHFRQAIGPHQVAGYRPLIYNETTQLIKSLIDFKGDPAAKIETGIGAIIHRMAYGDEIFKEHGQKILEMNREGMDIGGFAGSRFWLVDFFPPLQYIPSWFPGATFQRIAERSRVLSDYTRHEPWRLVLDRLTRPEGIGDCIAGRLIAKVGAKDTVRDTIAVMYFAGADTTTATIMIFLLCIMLHPEVQERIHEELDRVIGWERLPTFEDRASLVYVHAAWKEALRWRPILPFGIPHFTTEDQTFQGYWVPKGSVIIPNTGFMLRDPQVWESPELYRPERFLVPPAKNQPDPSIGFGYGRRVCPGRYLADEIGPTVAVAILWAFQLERIEGPARPEDVKWVDSMLSPPLPFKLQFRPRTDRMCEMLENI